MDLDQVRRAVVEGTEIEYLFEGNQWLPAAIARFQEGSHHSPYVTIQLLRHPANHSGVISLDEEDIQHRLRIKD